MPPPPANLSTPGTKAKLMPDGSAAAPADAPIEVQKAIWAANTIQDMPYKWGGGHAKIEDTGYDCSGTVSYALIHGGLLESPLPSGPFMRWGAKGRGTVDHGLRQRRPCLRGHRRPAARHQLVFLAHRLQAQVRQGAGARSPLAAHEAAGPRDSASATPSASNADPDRRQARPGAAAPTPDGTLALRT